MAKRNPLVRAQQFDGDAMRRRMQEDMAKMEVGRDPTVLPVLKRFSGRLAVRGELHNDWEIELSAGHAIEDTLDPTYWRDHVHRLIGTGQSRKGGRGDVVHVFKPDTGQYCKLLVIEAGPGFMRTVMIEAAAPEQAILPADSPYVTRWNAGKGGHEILRRADNYLMGAGPFQTLAGAVEWIKKDMAAREPQS